MSEPNSPPLSDSHKTNFETLQNAFESGDVCLVSCSDTKTGEPRAVICAINTMPDGEIELVPLAKLFDSNPYEEITPPEKA